MKILNQANLVQKAQNSATSSGKRSGICRCVCKKSFNARLSELDGFEYFVSSLQGKTVEEMIAKNRRLDRKRGSIHLVIGNMLPVMSDAVLSLLPTEMNHFWRSQHPALRWRLGEYDGFSYVQKILYGKSSQEMIAMVVQDAPPYVMHMMEVLRYDVLLLLTPDQQIFWKGIIELNKAKIDVSCVGVGKQTRYYSCFTVYSAKPMEIFFRNGMPCINLY